MAQATKARSSKRNALTNVALPTATRTTSRTRPSPNTPARRKRQLAQRVKRFESTLSVLPARLKQWQSTRPLPRLAQLGFSGWRLSKVLSLLLLGGAAGLIVWVHTDNRWFIYRENVQFNNLHYLDADQLYTASGLDSWNIFWLQPGSIRQHLLALPYVADAQMQTSLLGGVTITIQEAQPVALWLTNQGALWLMADGTALPAPAKNSANILQIVDNTQEAKTLDIHKGLAMDQDVLKSALMIKQQLPEITQLSFNKDYGLNFHLPSSSAWVYWGDGSSAATKFANLAAIQALIQTGKQQPQIIDVRFDRPYMH